MFHNVYFLLQRETINNLELDYEIQSKIASAALKLATEATARKSVRKLRKISYQQATNKVPLLFFPFYSL